MSAYSTASNANIYSKNNKKTFWESLLIIEQMEKEGKYYERPDVPKPSMPQHQFPPFKLKPPPAQAKQMRKLQFEHMLQPCVAEGTMTKMVDSKVEILEGKQAGEIQKNVLKYENISPDAELLVTISQNVKTQETYEHIKQLMEKVETTIASSGTDEGQFKRFVKGMQHNASFGSKNALEDVIDAHDPDNIQKIISVMDYQQPITNKNTDKPESLRYLRGRMGIDYDPTINLAASAGFPFGNEKKKEVLPEIHELFLEMCEVFKTKMNNKQIITWDGKHPELTTIKIKNKMEVGEVADLLEKARSYFVVPAAICLPFSVIQENIIDGLGEHSWAMCGFSWAKQGAEKLIKAFTTPANWKHPIDAKIYSDDMHIAFRGIKDGKEGIFLICSDVQYLDLSLRSENTELFINVLLSMLVDKDGVKIYDTMFENYIRYNCIKATNSWVSMPHGKTTYKTQALNSGIPGTTTFGTIATINPLVKIVTMMATKYQNDVYPVEEFEKLLVDGYKEHGFKLKEGTEKAIELIYDSPEGTILPVKILGQNIKRINTEKGLLWMNVPDEDAILISMIRPTKTFYGKGTQAFYEKSRYGMLRVFGNMVSGGYHYPEMYEIAKNHWNRMLKTEVILTKQHMENEMNMLLGTEEAMEYILQNLIDTQGQIAFDFPDIEFFQNIYEQDTFVQYNIKHSQSMTIISSNIPQTQETIISEMFDSQETLKIPNTTYQNTTYKITPQKEINYQIPKELTKQQKKLERKLKRKHLGIKRINDFNEKLKAENKWMKNGKIMIRTGVRIKNSNFGELDDETYDEDTREYLDILTETDVTQETMDNMITKEMEKRYGEDRDDWDAETINKLTDDYREIMYRLENEDRPLDMESDQETDEEEKDNIYDIMNDYDDRVGVSGVGRLQIE